MASDTLRSITGTFKTPEGVVFANKTLTWYRTTRKATPQGSTTVVDQPFYLQTDAQGQIDAEVLPGNYTVLLKLSDADRYFSITVPDQAGPFNVADLFDAAAIEPDVLADVQQLVLEARAWAVQPEGEEVDPDDYPGEYSALHHAEKAREWSETPEGQEVVPGSYSAFHHASKANRWAESPEGVEVLPGEFSALHWSEKAKGYAEDAAGEAEGVLRPNQQEVLFISDSQPIPADNPENEFGHDQVAAWQALLDEVAVAHPDATHLFFGGDVVDEGAQRDTKNATPMYDWPDWLDDAASRLPMSLASVYAISGNHDNDYGQITDEQFARTFHRARLALGKGYYAVEMGSVTYLMLSDYYPDTQGAIPRHVREWFARRVIEANAQGRFIIVMSHQPLHDIGLANSEGTNASQAASGWFKTFIAEPGQKVHAWFSGHTGAAEGETNNHAVYAGCHFFDVNLGLPGAYNADSGVPLWNLSYCKALFTEGSDQVVIRRWDHTAGAYVPSDEVTITAPRPIQISRVPEYDGRNAYDERHGVAETLHGNPRYSLHEHPREPDPVHEVVLGTDPLTTTSGSNTVVVSDPGHGLEDGRKVLFTNTFGSGFINGISPRNIDGVREISLIDSDSYSIEAGTAADASGATGGTGITRNARWRTLQSEPHWAERIASFIGRGVHVVGMGLGQALYLPFATANGGQGSTVDGDVTPQNADDLVDQFGFAGGYWAKLLDLSSRAASLVLTASSGPNKSDAVDVLELHPDKGPMALVGGFDWGRPCFATVNNSDFPVGPSGFYVPTFNSPHVDLGGRLNASDGYLEGSGSGEVWQVTAVVALKDGTSSEQPRVTLEHWSDASGTVKTAVARSWCSPDTDTGRADVAVSGLYPLAAGERIVVVVDEVSGDPGVTIDRVEFSGTRISVGS